jgi:lipid-binding SYLF domain-containing protein
MKNLKRLLSGLISVCAFSTMAFAADRAELIDRAKDASGVLRDTLAITDRGIPRDLLKNATCVATIPNVVSGGIVFGARYGKGLVSCRVNSRWSQASFLTIAGGSWGLQIGLQSTDVVLVFMNQNALERLSHNNFTIGGDASVSAGPLGREAQAGTDYKLGSEIYSYSRSRGLFAGLTVSGSSLSTDLVANATAYGHAVTAHDLLMTPASSSADSPDLYAQALTRNIR